MRRLFFLLMLFSSSLFNADREPGFLAAAAGAFREGLARGALGALEEALADAAEAPAPECPVSQELLALASDGFMERYGSGVKITAADAPRFFERLRGILESLALAEDGPAAGREGRLPPLDEIDVYLINSDFSPQTWSGRGAVWQESALTDHFKQFKPITPGYAPRPFCPARGVLYLNTVKLRTASHEPAEFNAVLEHALRKIKLGLPRHDYWVGVKKRLLDGTALLVIIAFLAKSRGETYVAVILVGLVEIMLFFPFCFACFLDVRDELRESYLKPDVIGRIDCATVGRPGARPRELLVYAASVVSAKRRAPSLAAIFNARASWLEEEPHREALRAARAALAGDPTPPEA